MLVSLADEFEIMRRAQSKARHNVNFIIFNTEGRVYLFKRFCRKSLEKSGQPDFNHPAVQKWYDIPGGRVDYPENHITAISRENMEELGIEVTDFLHLSTMPNPTPNCADGSQRYIYVVIKYSGEPVNKAGVSEGHMDFEAFEPSVAANILGHRIDDETKNFLTNLAPDYFSKFCQQNQTNKVPVCPNTSPAA